MSCASFVSQIDVANNIFWPAGALSTQIGLCKIAEYSQAVGILMVNINGVWGSDGVSYIPVLSNNVELKITQHNLT